MVADTKNFIVPVEDFPKFKKWLTGVLKDQSVKITFTKQDGSERVMNCTLREDTVVPYEKKSDREKKENPNIVAVWDIDKNEWRSFKIDSIKTVSFELGSNNEKV